MELYYKWKNLLILPNIAYITYDALSTPPNV